MLTASYRRAPEAVRHHLTESSAAIPMADLATLHKFVHHMPRSRRWPAALFGLLLSLVVSEPLRPHACAMHDPAAVLATGDQGTALAHGEHGHGADREAPAPHACSCLGTCCTVAPVRLATLPVVPEAVVTALQPDLPAILGSAPAARAERLLPFPNGPPTPA